MKRYRAFAIVYGADLLALIAIDRHNKEQA